MLQHRSLEYEFNSRTHRYKIKIDKALMVEKAIKKLIGKTAVKHMFIKVNNIGFEVYDFFLLELEFCLNFMKEENHILALDIGGIVLNDLLDFLRTKTWLHSRHIVNTKKLFDFNNLKKNMLYMPLEHQVSAFDKYEEIKQYANLKGGMLDIAAGGGKTFSSLAMVELLDYDLVIIIAPKNTLGEVWEKSVSEELYRQKQSNVILGTNSKVYNNEKFIITHYQYVEKILKDKKLARRVKRLKPALIIDEFHNLNEIKSERTNNILNFINYIKFRDVILLTGTPIKMVVNELVPMLYILDDKFPKVVDRFKEFYRSLTGIKVDLIRHRFNLYRKRIENTNPSMGNIELIEYKLKVPDGEQYTMGNINARMTEYKHTRLEELFNHMDEYELQFYTYIDSMSDLYKKDDAFIESKEKIKRYRRLVKIIRKASDDNKLFNFYTEVSEASLIEKEWILPKLKGYDKHNFKQLRSIIKYPKLKVLGEALGKILLGSRIRCYTSLAEQIDYKKHLLLTNKKGLVFSNYISVCNVAVERCRKQGYNPVGVYGDLIDNLDNNVKQFNDLETDINPIIATYKSLSTGVPLPSANIVILIDVPMRVYNLEQAISRSYRLGNYEDVLVLFTKLDTGTEFNITERDLFIVNTSEHNVELITGTSPVFDTPKQDLPLSELEDDEDDDGEVINEIKEEIEEIVLAEFNKMDVKIKLGTNPLDYVKSVLKKITFI